MVTCCDSLTYPTEIIFWEFLWFLELSSLRCSPIRFWILETIKMRMNKINLFDMETKCTSSSFIIPAQRDITSSAGDLTVQNVILNSYVCILANFRSTSAYHKIIHFDWLLIFSDFRFLSRCGISQIQKELHV